VKCEERAQQRDNERLVYSRPKGTKHLVTSRYVKAREVSELIEKAKK
jgi:hypothetical protein